MNEFVKNIVLEFKDLPWIFDGFVAYLSTTNDYNGRYIVVGLTASDTILYFPSQNYTAPNVKIDKTEIRKIHKTITKLSNFT